MKGRPLPQKEQLDFRVRQFMEMGKWGTAWLRLVTSDLLAHTARSGAVRAFLSDLGNWVGVGRLVSRAAACRPPLTHFHYMTFFVEMSFIGPMPMMDVDAEVKDETVSGFEEPIHVSPEKEAELLGQDTDDESLAPPEDMDSSIPLEGVGDLDSVKTISSASSKKKEAKKKYKLNKRLRLQAAKAAAETPSTSTAGGSKRPLSSASPANDNRERNPPAPKKLFSDAARSSFRIQITFSDWEERGLTVADLNNFKHALEGKVLSLKGTPRVQVDDCVLIGDVGLILCHDEDTAKWIRGQVGSLLGGAYKAWKEGEVPPPRPIVRRKLHKMWCWVGGAETPNPKSFFTALAQQNDLVTRQWRLYASPGREGGHTLMFTVDEESLPALERVNFRPYYGMGRLLIQRVDPTRGKVGTNARGSESVKPP